MYMCMHLYMGFYEPPCQVHRLRSSTTTSNASASARRGSRASREWKFFGRGSGPGALGPAGCSLGSFAKRYPETQRIVPFSKKKNDPSLAKAGKIGGF